MTQTNDASKQVKLKLSELLNVTSFSAFLTPVFTLAIL